MIEEPKITVSIGEVSVTIPKENGQIDDVFIAIELALELSGWHRSTIHQYIVERAEEIGEECDD